MDFIMIFKAVILGIVEGLTEFLPISSTGHLIIANKYLSFEGPFANTFAIVIQSGAILAVIIYFRHKVFPQSFAKKELRDYVSLWCKVVFAIIPLGVLGVLFSDMIEEKLFSPVPVAIALVLGAVLLIAVENMNKKRQASIVTENQITYKLAFLVGMAQCMAILPGMSRSASTIIGAMVLGFSRTIAAEFSFFLAIPVLLGASLVKLMKTGFSFTSMEWITLGVGTFVSFVVAYIVIAVFMNYIKSRDFKPFAYYRIILGVLIIVNAYFM